MDTTASKTAIKATNLTLNFGSIKILHKASFEIPAGQITYILGANGAGKSTLIKAILGLHPVYKGSLEIAGQPWDKKLVAAKIGYVPQYTGIDRTFPITVAEMIALECQDNEHCKVGEKGHLQMFGASNLLTRKISDLSGGELQKVLIARAMVSDPEIIIMDEPFNNLDHTAEIDLILLARQLQEQGKTVIIITHDHGLINLHKAYCLYLSHQEVHSGPAEAIIKEHNLGTV